MLSVPPLVPSVLSSTAPHPITSPTQLPFILLHPIITTHPFLIFILRTPMSTDVIPANEKPPRKFPAPCWGQDETLTLIAAYRDRWYALRRGYLRTADWDAVAAEIAAKSPADPAKTSAQCRHKMEKLRQRYRAVKQRCLSLSLPSLSSGQFPSSWFFFDSMDSMENGGSISAFGPDQGNQANNRDNGNSDHNYSGVLRIKSVNDRSLVDPVVKMRNFKMGFDRNPANLGFRGKIDGNYENPNVDLAYFDHVLDGDDLGEPNVGSGVRFRIPFEEKVVNSVRKVKKLGKIQGDYGAKCGANRYYVNGFSEDLPPGLRVKGKMAMNPCFFYSDVNSRAKNSVRCEMNTNVLNGGPSYGHGLWKKSGRRRGAKRERGAAEEMVASIKFLGEGYVRMEKMKMDMAQEMEKMRMEMELKRNELILESQRHIVDAFMSVLVENNKKKKKETPTMTTTTTVAAVVPKL